MNLNKSTLIITQSIDSVIEKIENKIASSQLRIFNRDKFLIDDAKDVIKEAYIKELNNKYIILASTYFNTYAQNSLLKIIEEPPLNTIFIIITTSKSSILATIKSRVQIKIVKSDKKITPLDINFRRMNETFIYDYLSKNMKIDKNSAKEFIQRALITINRDKIKLPNDVLDEFSKALKLIELNSKPINVVISLLIKIYKGVNCKVVK